MPIYEFICLDCGNKFEELIRNNQEIIKCPKCKGEKIRKNISLCGLKGSPSKSCPTTCKGLNCSTCR